MTLSLRYDTGSFRDPSGSVFHYDGRVYRSVDAKTFALMTQLADKGVFGSLIRSGYLIDTTLVRPSDTDAEALHPLVPGVELLRHQTVPFISYPCEWTFSMLADAGVHQLSLQLKLLEYGYSLKDASAYNTQFLGARPVFIDVASIEVPARKDLWIAYGQFCRMFLFPLLLSQYRCVDTKGYFLSHIDGMDVDSVCRILGRFSSLRPRLFVDVFLQRLLQEHGTGKVTLHKDSRAGGPTRHREGDSTGQKLNLRRLLRKIEGLAAAKKRTSAWSGYALQNSYSSEAEKEKVSFVSQVMDERRPQVVLDIGCNTGVYSMIAVKSGARTISIDCDHDCVDALYRTAKTEKLDILPLWVDIANPTPGAGFRNIERRSLLDRIQDAGGQCDCVLALALVHHLLVTSRIPLHEVSRLLADLTRRWLIVEFVPVDDPMFQQLLALRENIYGCLTKEYFEQTMSADFQIVAERKLSGSSRVLYLMEKRRPNAM